MSIPSGIVTFLFTDNEGSTKLVQEYPDEMPDLLARYHDILHLSIQAQNESVFQVVGDSFATAFHAAADVLNAAPRATTPLNLESMAGAWGECGDSKTC